MNELEKYNVEEMARANNVDALKFEKNVINKAGVAAMVYLHPANQMTMKHIADQLKIKVSFLSSLVQLHKLGA